jgi:hypothetical protein
MNSYLFTVDLVIEAFTIFVVVITMVVVWSVLSLVRDHS